MTKEIVEKKSPFRRSILYACFVAAIVFISTYLLYLINSDAMYWAGGINNFFDSASTSLTKFHWFFSVVRWVFGAWLFFNWEILVRKIFRHSSEEKVLYLIEFRTKLFCTLLLIELFAVQGLWGTLGAALGV